MASTYILIQMASFSSPLIPIFSVSYKWPPQLFLYEWPVYEFAQDKGKP